MTRAGPREYSNKRWLLLTCLSLLVLLIHICYVQAQGPGGGNVPPRGRAPPPPPAPPSQPDKPDAGDRAPPAPPVDEIVKAAEEVGKPSAEGERPADPSQRRPPVPPPPPPRDGGSDTYNEAGRVREENSARRPPNGAPGIASEQRGRAPPSPVDPHHAGYDDYPDEYREHDDHHDMHDRMHDRGDSGRQREDYDNYRGPPGGPEDAYMRQRERDAEAARRPSDSMGARDKERGRERDRERDRMDRERRRDKDRRQQRYDDGPPPPPHNDRNDIYYEEAGQPRSRRDNKKGWRGEDPPPPPPSQGDRYYDRHNPGGDKVDLHKYDVEDNIARHVDANAHIGGAPSDDMKPKDDTLIQEWEQQMQNFVPEMLVTFPLAGRSDEYFYEEVSDAPVQVRGGYFVSSDEDQSDVEFQITDPSGDVIYKKQTSEGLFYFTTKLAGVYSFIVSNHRWVESKMVTFAVGLGNDTALQPGHLNPIETHVEKIDRQLRDIQAESTYLWTRERSHFKAIEATKKRVLWFSIVEFIVLFSVATWQVYYIKGLLSDRRLL